jgi:N-glycosylase/DNA lyase
VRRATLRLPRPRGARLAAIVRSHGWSDLAPFSVEGSGRKLVLHGALPHANAAVVFRVVEAGAEFSVTLSSTRAIDRRALAAQLAELLSLDAELDPFYALTDDHPRLGYARRRGAGRLLRGASVWEDLVKVLLTTNCSWALTRKMVERLVAALGSVGPDGRRAFPTPAQVAARDVSFYRDEVKVGYRAPHLVSLARDVTDGALVLPTRADPRSDEDVRESLLALPGFGPYAADNLMRLLGRYRYLGLDSACRAELRSIYGHKSDSVADRAAAKRYRAYGEYAGLAMWLDVTRRWHV